MTSMLPNRYVCSLFMLSRIRCMAMSPRSSRLYAFATNSASKTVPTMHPCPLGHSGMNAAKHSLGYISRMYDPSITATSEPLVMDPCIQAVPPITCRCSHSQVFPHNQRISRNDVGAWAGLAQGLDEVRPQHPRPEWVQWSRLLLGGLLAGNVRGGI
jgi:hypothetical protein